MVYPNTCPLCEEIIAKDELVCCDCAPLIPYVNNPVCMKCGSEIEDETDEYCEDCKKSNRSFKQGFPAMNYVGAVKDSITAFKYHSMKNYAQFYANEIMKCHGDKIRELDIDVIIPVPIHKKKLKIRGYNQAELLADKLSDMLETPMDVDLLVRSSNTEPQKELDNIEREVNLKKAFNLTEDIVKYKKVMLVDDIYTTGATIEACSALLLENGAEEVYYTSICIGRR